MKINVSFTGGGNQSTQKTSTLNLSYTAFKFELVIRPDDSTDTESAVHSTFIDLCPNSCVLMGVNGHEQIKGLTLCLNS